MVNLNEFRDLCSDIPCQSTVVERDIVLIENTAPVKQAPDRMSPPQKKKILREAKFLLKHNLIEKSKSEWVSPVFIGFKSRRVHANV